MISRKSLTLQEAIAVPVTAVSALQWLTIAGV
jgi:hypothetical protein